MKDPRIIAILCICCLLPTGIFAELKLNTACQEILSNPQTGLVATTLDDFSYTHAERNTKAIVNALKRLKKNEDLLLPEGVYDIETILVAKTVAGCTIAGAGLDKTTLRRKGFSWDNNTQGDCPLRTEVLVADALTDFGIQDFTIDGNCHQIAICGIGTFNSSGVITSGLPQFPSFSATDGYQGSAGSVFNVRFCKNVLVDNVKFTNGFRWCVLIGKSNGFIMRNSIIDTGNLSTEFKGHLDAAPNNSLRHLHTSQDGIHMVNVSNALLEYNDIHSEDSAIAIELNPLWTWGGYDIIDNVVIKNNYVSTASPTDPAKLMTDEDVIYGSGLATSWIGQSAVDIFYNENFDIPGKVTMGGKEGTFRNIEIKENAFDGLRQGVRCGFFIGAGPNHAQHHHHRIYNLTIKDHHPNFMAGKDKNRQAGIKNITKNTHINSWNKSGGAGIAVRHTDSLLVSNNYIEKVTGGLGISLENVTCFEIIGNRIDDITGKQLGDLGVAWVGGEGIRVYNNPSLKEDPYLESGCFNAQQFLIKNNYIGDVEVEKIAVIYTKNGTVKLKDNYDLNGKRLCEVEKALNIHGSKSLDLGDCSGAGIGNRQKEQTIVPYPNPTNEDLFLESQFPYREMKFELLTLQGKKLYDGKLKKGTTTVPMTQLPAGTYLLVINDENENNKNEFKIIKN